MSPTLATLPAQPKGIKGKKVPGKPSRFDPSMPFHMSTRRGTNKSVSDSAHSPNGSGEDFGSRRPSLDTERPATAHSNGTQASKGTFASDFSPPQPVPDVDMSEAPLITPTGVSPDGERESRSSSRGQQTSPTTRKRKRSSPSPAPASSGDMMDQTELKEKVEDDYDSDTVQVVHQDDLSDREESGDEGAENREDDSPDSSQSQEVVPPYDAIAGTSVDVTPMISEQPSPATSGSPDEEEQDEDTTLAKPLAAALKEVAEAKKDEVLEAEQPEDETMLDAAQALEDADEIEEQVRTDDDGRMVVRRGRFGGRRRAQHPNPQIEMAMRRQAQLKTAYRAVARAQKSILAEVTQRTIEDLEADPDRHTRVEEYEEIVRELDAALEKRKAAIQAQHEMRLKQLKVTWDGEQDAVVAKCRQQLEDVEETKVDQLQYEFLRIARSAQLEDGNETEDEDDVIPRLKRTAYHWKRGAGLDSTYDSRSRLAIETHRATEDMQARYNMYEMLKELPDEDKPEKHSGFTVMDGRPRTAAWKTREGLDTLDMLVAAGAETERIARIPVVPNEECHGLQMLGDLASRPSIVGGRPPSSGSISGQLEDGSAPPPLRIQVPSGAGSIQVQMSPRTQLAMGNRFEPGHMPPPTTPRQDDGAPVTRSPDTRRHERRPSSPGRADWRNGLPFNETLRSPGRPQLKEPETLHHRIASADRTLQDNIFGSPRFQDLSGWRAFDAPQVPRRRAASELAAVTGIRSDPTSVDFRRDEEQRPASHTDRDDQPARYDPVRSQTIRWPDQHSQAGTSNGRGHDSASPMSEQLSTAATPGMQGSSTGGQDPSAASKKSRHASKGSRTGSFPHKTNKMERKGVPRRKWTKEMKHQQQQENGRPEAGGTPTLGPAHHAGSPPIDMRAPSSWFGIPPSMQSPHDIPPPGPYHHGARYGGPPHRNYPNPGQMFRHPSFDFGSSLHHSAFPPSLGPGFLPPSPSHRFGFGPPPGVPPEQYQRPFHPPPAPPPHSFQQHPLPNAPRTPHPQSAPGSGFANHPGGPPIAPAGQFQQGGFRLANNHLPAFAQQQAQNGGSFGGPRGRAKSDSTFPKFQPPWEPKQNRR